tara:strand:+ start:80 stop:604 length:525 start_codon:yes stop_codon:yes gene_type:complete
MSFESALLDWISEVTTLDAWQAPIDVAQNKPSGEYVTFQILSMVMSDFNQNVPEDKDDDFITTTIRNNATMLLSVNVFSYGGYQKLINLNSSTSFWKYRQQLAEAGITLNRFAQPQNLTGLGDTNFVDRWQADIEFRIVAESSNDWDKLKQIALGGTFIADDGNNINSLVKWPK